MIVSVAFSKFEYDCQSANPFITSLDLSVMYKDKESDLVDQQASHLICPDLQIVIHRMN